MGIKDLFPSMDDFHKVMRINLDIAIELNNYLIPEMQKRKWGRVVHVSSASAVVTRGSLCYTVAKAALNTYTESLGLQVARSGVNVSSVMPGAIAYPGSRWDTLMKEKTTEITKYLDEHCAINRFAKPEEVAAAITFLCGESAALFSGSQVRMDGGTY
jgi:3-oxoacyl-[acyl-carrier protein] reductase